MKEIKSGTTVKYFRSCLNENFQELLKLNQELLQRIEKIELQEISRKASKFKTSEKDYWYL